MRIHRLSNGEGRFSRYNLLELMIPSTNRPGSSAGSEEVPVSIPGTVRPFFLFSHILYGDLGKGEDTKMAILI